MKFIYWECNIIMLISIILSARMNRCRNGRSNYQLLRNWRIKRKTILEDYSSLLSLECQKITTWLSTYFFQYLVF